eukprot:TRINITY_DN12767_c0_g1_i1.p1 TRINITY_DN12767_c0_g1~~TRINITY_DN12767_c0_g1_i1.p1  ORF type:complete len:359 (-),score=29.39 TRINITY_DN12767_c0_g1_i1:64-1140(-)
MGAYQTKCSKPLTAKEEWEAVDGPELEWLDRVDLSTLGDLSAVPVEVLDQILSFCEWQTIMQVSKTNVTIGLVTTHALYGFQVWENLFKQEQWLVNAKDPLEQPRNEINWYEEFKNRYSCIDEQIARTEDSITVARAATASIETQVNKECKVIRQEWATKISRARRLQAAFLWPPLSIIVGTAMPYLNHYLAKLINPAAWLGCGLLTCTCLHIVWRVGVKDFRPSKFKKTLAWICAGILALEYPLWGLYRGLMWVVAAVMLYGGVLTTFGVLGLGLQRKFPNWIHRTKLVPHCVKQHVDSMALQHQLSTELASKADEFAVDLAASRGRVSRLEQQLAEKTMQKRAKKRAANKGGCTVM